MPGFFRSGAKEREQPEKAEQIQAQLQGKVGQLTIDEEFLGQKCELKWSGPLRRIIPNGYGLGYLARPNLLMET